MTGSGILEVLKQLTAVLPALLPLLVRRFSLLPFVNPQIADDLWPITFIMALLASSISYNFFRNSAKNSTSGYLALFSLVIAIVSLVGMLALVSDLTLSDHRILQDFLVRSMFVILFVSIGYCSGYAFAQVPSSNDK